MRDDSKMLATLAPILFRVWEKFFKFLSWLFMVGLLRAAYLKTGETALEWIYNVAMSGFTITLLAYTYWLTVRDPASYNVPPEWGRLAHVIQLVVALGLLVLITAPFLYLDRIIEALSTAR